MTLPAFRVPLPADNAPLSMGSVPLPADNAPLSVGSMTLPADDAPLSMGSVPLPADNAPLSMGSVTLPADDAPLSMGSVTLPADDAPLSTGSVTLPADDAPLSTGSVTLPADDALLSVGSVTLPADNALSFMGSASVFLGNVIESEGSIMQKAGNVPSQPFQLLPCKQGGIDVTMSNVASMKGKGRGRHNEGMDVGRGMAGMNAGTPIDFAMDPQATFAMLRERMLGKPIVNKRLFLSTLQLYLQPEPGAELGIEIWCEPSWQIVGPGGVVAASGTIDFDPEAEDPDESLRMVSQAAEALRGCVVEDASVAPLTFELEVRLSGGLAVRTFVSHPTEPEQWLLRDPSAAIWLRGTPAGLRLEPAPQSGDSG